MVDEATLARLPGYYRTLHDVLMAMPANTESYTFDFPEGLFGLGGQIALRTANIVDVYHGDKLNAPILQIWCM